MKFLSRIILLLSKKVTRKNLDHLIKQNINNIDNKKKKILNIGAGGYIQDLLESIDNTEITSIDIDLKRRPDILGDISSETVFTKIKIKPDVITCFEVLEHIKEPQKAINNLYKFSNKKTKLLFSVPFNFPIHDEPHDYYRYTKYGLEYLFKNFSNTQVIPRDGWLDTIFVFFIRLKFSKNYVLKILSIFMLIVYFVFLPLIDLIQKFLKFDKITTGYFIIANK
jgi:hypothetical protein